MTRFLPFLALLAACSPVPPVPDAAPDGQPADDHPQPPDAPDAQPAADATVDASSLDARADVLELDAALDSAVPDASDAGPEAALEAGADVPDAAPSMPPLSARVEELQYWVLYESYPGDGRGTPVVRQVPIAPSALHVSTGASTDRTVFNFQSCAATGLNGCEAISLTRVPRMRTCVSGTCVDVPESNEICATPSVAGVAQICSSSTISSALSPVYPDRSGRLRMNFCWTAALAPNLTRPAVWAVRGVPGRTTQPSRGDFCVFGYLVP